MKSTNYPVIDLHCDLLAYLAETPDATPMDTGEIGCAVPFLREGNVKLQVMAMYSPVEKGSSEFALQESQIFQKMVHENGDWQPLTAPEELAVLPELEKIGMVAAIENAAGFCEEDDDLKAGFGKLQQIISNVGRVLYITMTHHTENRFGGGNLTRVGLKEDGRSLLDYLDGRRIAVDFSHTSDFLADGILNHIDRKNLDIPILASHSNFRYIWNHPRNLPDEIAREIIKRKGIIGINFVRAFVNDKHPDALFDHIQYGLDLGAEALLAFGADFFSTASHPDQSRLPFFHPEHENAGKYPEILQALEERMPRAQIAGLAFKNALGFMQRVWE
ncbi:MAG: dipeptidase [bacterium]